MTTRRHFVSQSSVDALSALGSTLSAPARAQGSTWPTKPIRIIVPGGLGGVTDIRARWLAEKLTPVLGQSFVIENRAGAGRNLGTVARAHGYDGATLPDAA